MKKVIVTNSGRGAGINFCKSLRLADEKIELICLDKDKYSMLASEADQLYYCPPATSDEYIPFLKNLLKKQERIFYILQKLMKIYGLYLNTEMNWE